jgi:hypothetical protein
MPDPQPLEGASSLMGLFAPPPQSSVSWKKSEPDAAALEDSRTIDSTSNVHKFGNGLKRNISVEQFGAMARDEIQEYEDEDDLGDSRATFVSSNSSMDRRAPPSPLLKDDELEALFDSPHSHGKSKDKGVNDDTEDDELTPLVKKSTLSDLFNSPSQDITPKIGSTGRKTAPLSQRLQKMSNMPSIREAPIDLPTTSKDRIAMVRAKARKYLSEGLKPTTLIGSFMFLLYHIVFCLAMGSAITRPHGQIPILGLMTKMASLGIMFGASVYWLNIGSIPALYPTVDLFSAPFLAVIAAIVDEALHNDSNVSDEDNDQVFLATFTFLASLAIFISGLLLVLASIFRLANLGAFLPFPVLCGFFSAVGVMMWMLAFKVDTNGKSFGTVFFSGDWDLIYNSFIHHLPSVLIAIVMKYLGPKSPFFIIGLLFGSIGLAYSIMVVFNISMEEAVEREWFWSQADLVYEGMDSSVSWKGKLYFIL